MKVCVVQCFMNYKAFHKINACRSGFVVCFILVKFTHILHVYFTGTGATMVAPVPVKKMKE